MPTKSEHREYLKTPHWREFRKVSIGGCPICVHCGMPRWLAQIAYDQDLNVHHLTYANVGNETLEDVWNLCRRCHEIETFGRSELKEPKTARCSRCAKSHYDPYSDICSFCERCLDGGGHLLAKFLLEKERGLVDAEPPTIGEVLLYYYVRQLGGLDMRRTAARNEQNNDDWVERIEQLISRASDELDRGLVLMRELVEKAGT